MVRDARSIFAAYSCKPLRGKVGFSVRRGGALAETANLGISDALYFPTLPEVLHYLPILYPTLRTW